MLQNIQKYYKNLKHQTEAILWLQQKLYDNGYGTIDLLNLSGDCAVLLERKLSQTTLQIFNDMWHNYTRQPVPYYSQLDNSIKPYVTCNSSANAMLLKSCLPDALPQGDDEYVRKVMSGMFGRENTKNPSIYHEVHTKALRYYGLHTDWRVGLTKEKIRELIKRQPLVVNIWHKGDITAPTGGHVIVLTELNDVFLTVHDPYGMFNWKTGQYNHQIEGIYSVNLDNFMKRSQGGFREVLGRLPQT